MDHPSFEFALPCEIKAGDTISIFMGSPEKNKEESRKKGNRGQTMIQRRRPFHLYIVPKARGLPRPGNLYNRCAWKRPEEIRIVAPSLVAKNKRFDVIIRFEDVLKSDKQCRRRHTCRGFL